MAPAKSTGHQSFTFLRIEDSALIQFDFEAKPFEPFRQNEHFQELVQQNNNHDNGRDNIRLDYFCTTYFFVCKQAYQLEAAFLIIFKPQIERQTHYWYYLIHCQIIIQAFGYVLLKSDIFLPLWICGQFFFLCFENKHDHLWDEENDKNKQEPENRTHVVDERDELVSDKL